MIDYILVRKWLPHKAYNEADMRVAVMVGPLRAGLGKDTLRETADGCCVVHDDGGPVITVRRHYTGQPVFPGVDWNDDYTP